MVEFKRELQQSNGQHFVYVRPLGDATDDDWVDYFTTQFDTTPVAEFFMLVDLVGIEDSIGLEGFTRLSDLIKAQGFRRPRIAVLPPNEHYPALAKIFSFAAGSRDLDFKIELFRDRAAAEEWLGAQ